MTNEQKLEIVKKALEKGATIRISLYNDKTRHDAAETIKEVCGCNGEYGCGERAHWVEVMEEDFYVTAFFEEEKTPRRQPEQIEK